MNRIFGMGKAKASKPTLDDAITSTDSRVEAVEVKIKKLDGELIRFREQMNKMRNGPGKDAVKQRALRVMKQKKMYEAQRDQLMQQSFNMESAVFATENIKNTMSTMQAMQDANKAMKKQYKDVDIDKIYDMQDEMAELLEQASEVQELMGRSYNLPEDLDEQDLEAELDALGDDLMFEENEVPSYLNDAAESEMPELLPDAPDGAISQQPVPDKPAETQHATSEHAMRM
ncbi:Vacuolar protein-sorting-associated protein 60 [Coemansia sp. RSA 1933]|nr:Vacuolar protein-sorting-associated protein 60 [Coemansia sp. RSA 1933]